MDSAPDFTALLFQPLTWVLLAAYFAPTILAILGRSSGWVVCFWVNLFFGWTLIGWLICLMIGNAPTKAQLAYRAEVACARDEFYLRERT